VFVTRPAAGRGIMVHARPQVSRKPLGSGGMKKKQLAVHVRRMVCEADNRIADANFLRQSLVKRSDADYLLSLLAFEILLKATVHILTGSQEKSHCYPELFTALPQDARERIVAAAQERMSTSANYTAVNDLLRAFSQNFVALRYPYEKYERLNEAEYKELGDQWLERGALESEATFTYHPMELDGLLFALRGEVERWLAAT
jgi:hypothetical protein